MEAKHEIAAGSAHTVAVIGRRGAAHSAIDLPARAAAKARSLALIACGLWLLPTAARSAPAYEVDRLVEFKPATAKARATLQRVPSLRDLVAEDFEFAGIDLNDDGRNEVLVLARSSSYCGSGGCMLVVLEQRGDKVATLLTMNTDGSLGVTRNKVGAYRALAAVDSKGAIVVGDKPGAPLHGKPLVYPLAGARLPSGGVQATIVTAPESQAGAKAAVVRAESATASQPRSGYVLDVVGIRLGMTVAEARRALAQLDAPAKEDRVVEADIAGLPNSRRTQVITALSETLGSFDLQFAPAPAEHRLVRIGRVVDHRRDKAAPVSAANLRSALVQKYGEPQLFQYPGSESVRLQWLWSPTGGRAPAAAYDKCFANDDRPFAWSPMSSEIRMRSAAYLDPCGVALEVVVETSAGIVTRMNLRASDVEASVGARVATSRALSEVARKSNEKALEGAKGNKPAI